MIPDDTEMLGGPGLGGVPIATIRRSVTGQPAVFVRTLAMAYGTGCKPAGEPT